MPPKRQSTRTKRKIHDSDLNDEEWEEEKKLSRGNSHQNSHQNQSRPKSMNMLLLGRNQLGNDSLISEQSRIEESYDFSHLTLKKDHIHRPIWITPNGIIILEAFSPIYQQAYDFLVAIAEPVARPEFVHRYLLTPYSLYAAVAVSIDTESIIQVLNRLCKTEVPAVVEDFIRASTATFGKAKLVLKDNVYHVESAFPDVLRKLLKNPEIAACRLVDDSSSTTDGFTRYTVAQEIESNLKIARTGEEIDQAGNQADSIEGLVRPDADEEDDVAEDVIAGTTAGKSRHIAAFKVAREKVEVSEISFYFIVSSNII
jgi:hypothetical protein